MNPLRVLVGCEKSGVIRRAFRALGHDAWSCDLEPAEDHSEFHLQGDVLSVLDRQWDEAILHPPCTYLTVSVNGPITHGCSLYTAAEGQRRRVDAIAFFMACIHAAVPRVAVENPVGIMSTRYRKPDQFIQPYQFGDDASKKTGLWLKNLPPLVLDPAAYVTPRMVCRNGHCYPWEDNANHCPDCGEVGRPRWANQTDSGQNKLPPSANRSALRSVTYEGIANAMAAQWSKPGNSLINQLSPSGGRGLPTT